MHVNISDAAIDKIIAEYTREAGVRNLEREIASVCRKVAKDVVLVHQKNGKKRKAGAAAKSITVDPATIERYLGVPRFRNRRRSEKNRVGSVIQP